MFTALAPYASTPPSPKSSAWNASATLTAITAAQGPNSTATSAPPTACAVVPSGIGTLNIMTRKHTAESSARVGACLVLTTFLTWLAASATTGTATTNPATQVCGLRYPSGMCMTAPCHAATSFKQDRRPDQS